MGAIVAVSCHTPDGARYIVELLIDTPMIGIDAGVSVGVGVGGTGVGVGTVVTLTVHVAVMPLEVVTVITAEPGLTAVTNPLGDTFTTYILLELQLNALL